MSNTYNIPLDTTGLYVLKACIRATCHYCAAEPGSFYGDRQLARVDGEIFHKAEPFDGYAFYKATNIRRAFAFMEEVNQ